MSEGDKFYKLFLGDCALGPQCFFKCKYKYDQSSADIRIGDFWGDTYKGNEDGVSTVIAFSQKGKEIIEKTNCQLKEYPFDVAAEGQMKSRPQYKEWYESILKDLSDPLKDIDDSITLLNRYRRKEKLSKLLHHPIRTIIKKIRGHS